jgi:peptide/nickel transport system permease protein
MMSKSYILERLIQSVVLVFAVIVFNFTIMQLAPGDPAAYLMGTQPGTDPEYLDALRKKYGLDEPVHIQLLTYVSRVVQGDLGTSYRSGGTTVDVILGRLPATLLLMLPAFVLSVLIGTALGVAASIWRGSGIDYAITGLALIGFSIPTFWLGLILMLFFSVQLGWLPSSGMYTAGVTLTGWPLAVDVARHMLLPVITLSSAYVAIFARVGRASMLEVLRQDFIVTAWAKGLKPRTVYVRHALRNALLPLTTLAGLIFGFLFAGAAVTETIFSWPGIGRLVFDSTLARDYPIISGVFLLVSVLVILSNFLTDVAYSFLDPRIRER